MSEAAEGATPSRSAWQPFTFGGVAAFAEAGLARLLVVQLVAALLIGGIVVYVLQRDYSPVVLQAILEMPETAKITKGRLAGINDTVIAERKWIAIAITPETSGEIGQSADVQIQLRPTNFRIGTVFRPDWGWEFGYGPDDVDLRRSTLEPWWGAWHPVFLTLAGVSTVFVMYINWALLALIYTLPAKFVAWFADRQLSWSGAWRLAEAALLPGALLQGAAILLYGWRGIDLIGLAFFFVAHIVAGWVYVVGGAWARPRLFTDPLNRNPFKP